MKQNQMLMLGAVAVVGFMVFKNSQAQAGGYGGQGSLPSGGQGGYSGGQGGYSGGSYGGSQMGRSPQRRVAAR